MGAGISICHCNSSHATSPGKATLRSLSQPDRVNATAAGHDSFFTVGRSLTAPSASPKSLGPRRNGSYKPQKAASDDSIESHMKEHNNNAIPSPKSKALVKEEQTKCSTSPELTSSDSALVIDLTEGNTESRAESSSAENRGTLPSQAHRPKSAAPSRSLRRSCRRQRSMKKEQIQEVGNSEKSCENLDDLPPFRRFRPKSARDPRRRSNRVTDFRGQSSQLSRSLSMPSRKTLKLQLKRSDGESSDLSDDISLSSDTDDDQVNISSSDTLSIPDETDPSCGNTVTTITVKPKFGHSGLGYRKNPKLSQNPQTDASEVKGGIWERSSLTKSASTTITASKDDNNNRAKSAVGRLNALVGANNADENDNEDYNDDNNNSSYNNNFFSTSYHGSGFADDRVGGSGFSKKSCACGQPKSAMKQAARVSPQADLTDLEDRATRKRDASCKTIASRPDSGIAGSSSASYASSETALLEGRHGSHADLLASSLEMLEHVYQVRPEGHPTVTSLVKALTVKCHSGQAKAHAIYRWLSGQSLNYYKCVSCSNPSSPSSKMKQLAEGRTSYAALYREMARSAGLKCELIEGHVKGVKYSPGSPALCAATTHSWNAVSLNGHYALLDAHLGSLPYKFFLEHYFMTPPDEFCMSHYPRDKRWLLMTRAISEEDFYGALKTWPTMFAFNIRPLSMRSVIRTYDGRLSVTVLLRSVAVTPVLEYSGPGEPLDTDALSLGIDQEIRNTDNAETFHMCLPQEGDYLFTLMVHDVEEDEDIPVFQYKIEYKDELL